MKRNMLRYGNDTFGRVLHDWQRKNAFGLAGSDKWPKEGMAPRVIETVGIRMVHKILPVGQELNATARRGRRCVAQCVRCGTWVCAGHVGQHLYACLKEG